MLWMVIGCAPNQQEQVQAVVDQHGPFADCGTVEVKSTWNDVGSDTVTCNVREPVGFDAWTCFEEAQQSCTPSQVAVLEGGDTATVFVLEDCTEVRVQSAIRSNCEAASHVWSTTCETVALVDGACTEVEE